MIKQIKKRHIIVLLALLLPFWLLGISNYFFSSSSYRYAHDGALLWEGNIDGILMIIAISIFIAGIWVAGLYKGFLDKYIDQINTGITGKIKDIKENPRKILLHCVILISIFGLALLMEILLSRTSLFRYFSFLVRVARLSFYMAGGLTVYFIYLFRNKPEKLFLSLSLLIGAVYVIAPQPFWYAWDNGVHYAWSVAESFIWNVSVSRADHLVAQAPEYHSFLQYEITNNLAGLLEGRSDAVIYSFRKGTDTFAWSMFYHPFIYNRLAHIPAGLMIFAGRSLTLPPIIIIKLGTVINHIIYTLLVYFSMKRLSSGKYLLAVIAMFPTAFVLSTTYGYDHWMIGFLMLGFAYYFHEIQNPDKKIETKSIIIMIISFVVALGPKAVYVPIMLILYFIKKEKFNTEKGRRAYLAAVTASIIFVFASFAIPYIFSGGGGYYEDFRGGSNVDAVSQTMYVLKNPFTYMVTYLRFLIPYLNIFDQNYITYFAHSGYSSFFHLVLILLWFVTITDRNDKDMLTSSIKYKIIVTAVLFATISVFSLSMYIGFTDLGATEIAGVQGRYLIPLLFPFLYSAGGFKIQNNINKTAYTCFVFGIMSLVLLSGAWEKFIVNT